jgi:hypothetical protein
MNLKVPSKSSRALFWRILVAFLIFWGITMAILTYRNYGEQRDSINSQIDSMQQMTSLNCRSNLDSEKTTPSDLDFMLTENSCSLSQYQGAVVLRYYNDDVQEVSRSRTMIGVVHDENQAFYTVLFDQVLTQQEMTAISDAVRSNQQTQSYNPSLFDQAADHSSYGEIVGIVEGTTIIPQKLTYYYGDHTVEVMNSSSEQFSNAQCQTIRLTHSYIVSPLFGNTPYSTVFSRLSEANQSLDEFEAENASNFSGKSGTKHAIVGMLNENNVILGVAYTYSDLYAATYGLLAVYITTFLLAVILALILAKVLHRNMILHQSQVLSE